MHLLHRVGCVYRVDASLPFYWRMETRLASKTQSITKCLNIQKFTGTPKDGKY